MQTKIIYGDIVQQDVEVIVNSWNRNIIPWWLLLPQGVSGAIKKHGGSMPFKELSRMGAIPLGDARETCAGSLPYKSIIHVAGINMFWFATEYSVRQSVISAMTIVNRKNYRSVAFPLIGSGSGNRHRTWSMNIMQNTFKEMDSDAEISIIIYKNRINSDREV